MHALWCRLPVVVRAVMTGWLAASAGTLPWALLVGLNTRHGSSIPWAVPVTAVYLWLYWQYIGGAGWPHSTSPGRRRLRRANRIGDDAWGAAILAGILGVVTVLLFQSVYARMVRLPQQQDIDPSKYPVLTVFLWIVMGSIVAGVVEEASFRGYMQGPIERRHGPWVAFLLVGLMFGVAHFAHPEVGLSLLPFYLGIATAYGALAWLTDSILPGLVLHAGGDILGAFQFFATGHSEWQGSQATPLIWESGSDAAFWAMVIATLAVGAAAVAAYVSLARIAKASRERSAA